MGKTETTAVLSPELDTPQTQTEPAKVCHTNWEVFDQGNFYPTRIMCQDYAPMQGHDSSCHSNLLPTSEAIVRHMADDHGSGGGFSLWLRHTDGKTSPLWKDLKSAGIELHDFRCDVCDKELPLVARTIHKHLASHSGKSRMSRPGGQFHMTLKFETPDYDQLEESF